MSALDLVGQVVTNIHRSVYEIYDVLGIRRTTEVFNGDELVFDNGMPLTRLWLFYFNVSSLTVYEINLKYGTITEKVEL